MSPSDPDGAPGFEIPDVPLGGMVARLRSKDVDFDAALAAGPGHMLDYFSEVIGGITAAHTAELERLKFFHAIYRRTRIVVWPGLWKPVAPDKVVMLRAIVDELMPSASGTLRPLLTDLRALFAAAVAERCPVAFMLATDLTKEELTRTLTDFLTEVDEPGGLIAQFRAWIARRYVNGVRALGA